MKQGLTPGNSSEFNIAHGIDLHTNYCRVAQCVLVWSRQVHVQFCKYIIFQDMWMTRKTLHPRNDMFYHWENTFSHPIFLAHHWSNLHYTTLPTSVVFYFRGHVSLDLKSPVSVCFPTEGTLGMLFVPHSGALSLKVIYTKQYND